MCELGCLFPRERLSPHTVGPIPIQGLVVGVVNGLVVDVDGIFNEIPAFDFALLLIVVPFNLDGPHVGVLEHVENGGGQNIGVLLLLDVLVEGVHVLQDLKGSGTHGPVQGIMDLFDYLRLSYVTNSLLLRKFMK